MSNMSITEWLNKIDLTEEERTETANYIQSCQFELKDLVEFTEDFAKEFFVQDNLPSARVVAIFRIRKAIMNLKNGDDNNNGHPSASPAPSQNRFSGQEEEKPLIPVNESSSEDKIDEQAVELKEDLKEEEDLEPRELQYSEWSTEMLLEYIKEQSEMVKIKKETLDKIIHVFESKGLDGSALADVGSLTGEEAFKKISLGGRHKLRKVLKRITEEEPTKWGIPRPKPPPAEEEKAEVPDDQQQNQQQQQAAPAPAAAPSQPSVAQQQTVSNHQPIISNPVPAAVVQVPSSPSPVVVQQQQPMPAVAPPIPQTYAQPIAQPAPPAAFEQPPQPNPYFHVEEKQQNVVATVSHPPSVSHAHPGPRKWYWWDDCNMWYPYDDETSAQIEQAWSANNKYVVLSRGGFFAMRPSQYAVKFDNVNKTHYQVNNATSEHRPVMPSDSDAFQDFARENPKCISGHPKSAPATDPPAAAMAMPMHPGHGPVGNQNDPFAQAMLGNAGGGMAAMMNNFGVPGGMFGPPGGGGAGFGFNH